MEKPACVKTHLRNMVIVPEMIGSVVGIHQGKTFNQVEIKVGTPLAPSLFLTIAPPPPPPPSLSAGRDGWEIFG